MGDFFYRSEDDLRAHQPDTQEFWVNAINLQASGWTGGQPYPPQYQLPPPAYSVPQLPAPGYLSPPVYPVPYQFAYPQVEAVPPMVIGTPYAWPMEMTSQFPASQGTTWHQIHRPTGGLKPWYIIVGVLLLIVLFSSVASMFAASKAPTVSWVDQVPTTANTWNHLCPQTVPSDNGNPYAIVGKPDLSVKFVNQVLAYYHSPAAGQAKQLIEATSRCGIKIGAALAFFMHESTLGTLGEATSTYSLGNMRCIPAIKFLSCVDQSRGGYTQMPSWADGFVIWSRMMRNLYVDTWGDVTIDQVIPTYAPNSDNNNEYGYISSWKYCLDTWHKGVIAV